MADQRKPYLVDIGGVKHTMLLTRAGARRYGDRADEVKERVPENKSRQPRNKATK